MLEFPESLVPVIDVLHGQAVRGRGGERSSYRTLAEEGFGSADPVEVALNFRKRFGVELLYVADIDALQGSPPNVRLFAKLIERGFRLVVDAAWTAPWSESSCAALTNWGSTLIPIVSVESLAAAVEKSAAEKAGPSRAELTSLLIEARKRLPNTESLFSLDLKQGSLWFGPSKTRESAVRVETDEPRRELDWIDAAVSSGFQRILLLDLADVGNERGTSTIELLKTVRGVYPQIEWWGGGGIRGHQDVDRLTAAGFQKLLIASALHQPGEFGSE